MSGFNLAIITSQGRLFLWGDNQQQQLGFKSVKVILIPKEIPIEIYDPTKETFKSIQFLTNKTILVLKDEQIIVLGHFKNQLPVIRCHYGMFYPPMVISKSNIS
jgi:alpha-tubulin suppressor-like RCC1 family protein